MPRYGRPASSAVSRPVCANEKNPALSLARERLGTYRLVPHPADQPRLSLLPVPSARPTLAEVSLADLYLLKRHLERVIILLRAAEFVLTIFRRPAEGTP